MANKKTKTEAIVPDKSYMRGEKAGTPGKPGMHEGVAGAGEMRDLGNRKFNKETRDEISEKEPGKSRGPGG